MPPELLTRIAERAAEIQAPWLGDSKRKFQHTEAIIQAYYELTTGSARYQHWLRACESRSPRSR